MTQLPCCVVGSHVLADNEANYQQGRRMAQGIEQLNTTIRVVTPENIAFEYRIAGPSRRLLAYLIDLMLRCFIFFACSILVGWTFGILGLWGFGAALFVVLWFLFDWFYGGILETFWNGQTVGKKAMGLRVLTAEGQPINGMQAVMRNILRAVASGGWRDVPVDAASGGCLVCGTGAEPHWHHALACGDGALDPSAVAYQLRGCDPVACAEIAA
ncbi:MAG: RDD family protein, partial [Pirellulales bacterium]